MGLLLSYSLGVFEVLNDRTELLLVEFLFLSRVLTSAALEDLVVLLLEHLWMIREKPAAVVKIGDQLLYCFCFPNIIPLVVGNKIVGRK